MVAPVTYDLRNDAHAARFGLDPAERDYLMTRCFPDRNGGSVEGIGVHIQDGRTHGSLGWWVNGVVNGVRVQASSTILINRDGARVLCIPERHGPWTNGAIRNPNRSRIGHLLDLGGNLNNWVVTIELEAYSWESVTEAQWVTLEWVCRDWMTRYPRISTKDIFGHYCADSVDRAHCGKYDLELIRRLSSGTGPAAPTPKPAGFATVTRYPAPIPVTVAASAGLNLRQWGELDAQVYETLPHGTTVYASGDVIGDRVDGEAGWYIVAGSRSGRIWSGGTNKPLGD